jgi:hypothetical protein
MFGYCLWKSAITLFITANWRCVNGFQNVIVTGLPSYGGGPFPEPPDDPELLDPVLLPPQALIASAETTTASTEAKRPIPLLQLVRNLS